MDAAPGPTSVLVSLGSNIDPEFNLRTAVAKLATVVAVTAVSRVFVTRAVAERPMPDFLNAAVEIVSPLSAAELKYGVFRDLEWRLGRRRAAGRDAPRPIDIDIAIYGDRVIDSEPLGLQIPDPEILTRPHVAVPLADLAPGRRHPVSGAALSAIAGSLEAAAVPGTIRLAPHSDLLSGLVGSV